MVNFIVLGRLAIYTKTMRSTSELAGPAETIFKGVGLVHS